MWKPDTLIRHKRTGDCVLAIEVHERWTSVVDLKEASPMKTPKIILQCQYDDWTRDLDQENTDPINYEGKWHTTPMIV